MALAAGELNLPDLALKVGIGLIIGLILALGSAIAVDYLGLLSARPGGWRRYPPLAGAASPKWTARLVADTNEKRPLSVEMALRFADLVATEPNALMYVQVDFDSWQAHHTMKILGEIRAWRDH
jgi:hypothetical protein